MNKCLFSLLFHLQYPEPNRPWPGGTSPAPSPGPSGHPHPPASPHQSQHGGPPPSSSPGHAPSPSPQPSQASPSPHQVINYLHRCAPRHFAFYIYVYYVCALLAMAIKWISLLSACRCLNKLMFTSRTADCGTVVPTLVVVLLLCVCA